MYLSSEKHFTGTLRFDFNHYLQHIYRHYLITMCWYFTNPAHIQQHRNYFFLSILLIMALTSTGAEAAASLAFSSSSCCQRIMGWMPRLRFWAFCSSWAGLRERGHMYYKSHYDFEISTGFSCNYQANFIMTMVLNA